MAAVEGEDEIRRLATKRVQARRGLWDHLLVYAVVNGALILVWLATGRGYPWFMWPIIGWGIALIFHAMSVALEMRSPERDARAVDREMTRLRGQRRHA